MKRKLDFCITMTFFLTIPLLSSGQVDQVELYKISRDVLKFYIGNAKVIDADETSYFSGGNIILRKDNQYAVMGRYGEIIIPYGEYLYEVPLRPHNNYRPVHFANWMTQVRSPESGLYGFIDPNGTERIPLKYNEVTPVTFTSDQNLSAYSIGTIFTPDGKRERFFLSAFLENYETPITNTDVADLLVRTKSHPYWIIQGRNKYDGYSRFFNLKGDKVSVLKKQAQYYGGFLFRVDSSFNGLKKMAFVDHKDSVIAPYQNSGEFLMTHFQPVSGSRFVSLLSGLNQNSFFDYALMDDRGNIYSRLKSGNDFDKISLENNGTDIIRDKVLLWARQQESDLAPYLWDVRGDKKLVNIEKLFLDKNSKQLEIGMDHVLDYQFKYISREGGRNTGGSNVYLKFQLSITYKPIPVIMAYKPWGKKNYSSGIGGGSLYSFTVTGYGLMNEDTGEILAQPIYSEIGEIDDLTGIAYAKLEVEGKTYKGFIEPQLFNEDFWAAPFRFLLED